MLRLSVGDDAIELGNDDVLLSTYTFPLVIANEQELEIVLWHVLDAETEDARTWLLNHLAEPIAAERIENDAS
jgi:hypothetical protein